MGLCTVNLVERMTISGSNSTDRRSAPATSVVIIMATRVTNCQPGSSSGNTIHSYCYIYLWSQPISQCFVNVSLRLYTSLGFSIPAQSHSRTIMITDHSLEVPIISTLRIPLLFESVLFGAVMFSNALGHVTVAETQGTRDELGSLYFLNCHIVGSYSGLLF